jgi:hypothetical protein
VRNYLTPIRSCDDSADASWEDGPGPNDGSQDDPYIKADADGFRLPCINEWELAARYRDGVLWTYGDHASGDESGACYDDGDMLGGLGISILFVDYATYMGIHFTPA